jgi:hypothetical protein
MAAQNKDDFDVLKFFITVMALLTAIVAVFAIVLYGKVSATTKDIKRELATLQEMDKLAGDAPFRDWIGREREGKNQGTGTPADFKALLSDHAGKIGLHVKDTGEAGTIEHPGGTRELRFRLRVEDARIEQITRFLVQVEQDWPGSKTREIPELTLNEKTGNTWNASLVLAIFKHTDQS